MPSEDQLRSGMTWAYRVVCTEGNAGGGTITVQISPGMGNELQIIAYRIGTDDYGAGRAVVLGFHDMNGVIMSTIGYIAALDNAVWYTDGLRANVSTTTATTAGAIGQPDKLIVSGDDSIRLVANTLAQNETLTFNIRCRMAFGPPTVTITSTGTIGTPVVTYNEVL